MSSNQNLQEKVGQFEQNERSVGISLQAFKQKFVFNQNSGPDAIYLDPLTQSSSQLLSMTKQQQSLCVYLMSDIIFKAGQMLKLPVSTTVVAINIAQYYYTRKSFIQMDLRDVALGAVYLACKSQETLRRSYQVAAVFDWCFKMYQGQRNPKQLELNSPEYDYIKEKVIQIQNELLFELGFEVYKLFDIPHRYISGLLASFNRHKQSNEIAQNSWCFLNDIYRTKASIYYPGQVIAAAAVFMALQKLQIPLPDKPWWILMEASLKQVRNVFAMTNEMYQLTKQNKLNINKVSDILEKIGKEKLNVCNVFPVPYYRKITLDKNGSIKKIIEVIIEKPVEKVPQTVDKIEEIDRRKKQMESEDEKSEHEHKQRSKKEKKKHKKKNKHHKNGNRSRSRSQERNKTPKKGKYQNDDETPKIHRKQADLNEKKVKQNSQQKNILIQHEQNVKSQQNGHKIEEETMRKGSEVDSVKQSIKQPVKKSALLDAKSMLLKMSQQLKKIQVKKEATVTVVQESVKQLALQSKTQNGDKNKESSNKASSSDSDEEDELLAELIQIKKKNLQKREEKEQGQA